MRNNFNNTLRTAVTASNDILFGGQKIIKVRIEHNRDGEVYTDAFWRADQPHNRTNLIRLTNFKRDYTAHDATIWCDAICKAARSEGVDKMLINQNIKALGL
jgi:hypothetical protein